MRRDSKLGLRLRMMVVVAWALSFPPAASAIEDSPQARAAQADRYIEAMPPKDMISDLAKQISQSMPPEQAQKFRDVMMKEIDLTTLEKAMRAAMIKNFTAPELSALADFYGSDVGKSAMTKFRPYMADLMPTMQAEMLKVQAKMEKEMGNTGGQ